MLVCIHTQYVHIYGDLWTCICGDVYIYIYTIYTYDVIFRGEIYCLRGNSLYVLSTCADDDDDVYLSRLQHVTLYSYSPYKNMCTCIELSFAFM